MACETTLWALWAALKGNVKDAPISPCHGRDTSLSYAYDNCLYNLRLRSQLGHSDWLYRICVLVMVMELLNRQALAHTSNRSPYCLGGGQVAGLLTARPLGRRGGWPNGYISGVANSSANWLQPRANRCLL